MKLYATVTSERATKGQGGNEYIRITLYGEKNEPPRYRVEYGANGILLMDGAYKTLYQDYTKGEK